LILLKKGEEKGRGIKNTIEKEKEIEMYNTKIHFFMAIAHEIRTPLTLINIPLEELTEKYKDDENINKQLNLISKNSKRLSELSAQLLNFKKADNSDNQLKYTKIDIVSYINELLFMFSSSIKKKGIEIKNYFHLPQLRHI
jgi:Signal transduction histidine kinase